jgi:hypothetical protein
MPKHQHDRTPACIAYRDDGTLCRAPAPILNPERGGLVCWRHDMARADRFGWSDGAIIISPPPEEAP